MKEIRQVIGNSIRVQKNLPFSFAFVKTSKFHSIRVRVFFNSNEVDYRHMNTLRLDDWQFFYGPDKTLIPDILLQKCNKFFRRYLVLFAATWDRQLADGDVYDYLVGDITLPELIETFDFYNEYADELDEISSVSELEEFCRERDLVNLYGN